MKWIKLFEDFKQNNREGDLITIEDIIRAKESGEKIYATIIEDIPGNDPDEPLSLLDIDEDGLITVDYKGKTGYVQLKDVKRIGSKEDKQIDNE